MDKDTIMRHGGWKSSTVAEGYVETSVESKKRVAHMIMGEEPAQKSRKVDVVDIHTSPNDGAFQLNHCYSCTININIHNK